MASRGRFRDGIRQLGPGRWEVVVSWRDEAGKLRQVSRSVRGSRPEAQRIRDELRQRHHRNDLERAPSEDFETVLNEWLAMRERPLSPSTVEGYLGDIRRYIAPSLGKIRVSRMTARDLDRFYLSMQERGLGAGTIGRLHSIVRSALEQARRWRLVPENVARDASPPRRPVARIPAVPPESVSAILHVADGWFEVLFRVAAVTGARRGEAVGLQWRDVDLNEATITIRRSVVRSRDNVRVVRETTKTNRDGVVSIDEVTVDMLRQWRRRCVESALAFGGSIEDQSFLFSPQPDGSIPRWPKDVNYAFSRICSQLGIEGISFKDATRHFVATQLVSHGRDVRTVAGRLRHASPAKTLDVYAAFLPERDREAAVMIADIIADGKSAAR
jgi:integrase